MCQAMLPRWQCNASLLLLLLLSPRALQVTPCLRSIPNTPTLRSPPLSTNSTALKWDTPMPSIPARVAAASLLAQLVQLPALREAASDRLAASRLTVLLNSLSQQLLEARGEHV
jgi:hypothetical protein